MKTATPAAEPDFSLAQPVPPYRHDLTARTVAAHQPAGEGLVHLFSATGQFITTENAPAPESSLVIPKS